MKYYRAPIKNKTITKAKTKLKKATKKIKQKVDDIMLDIDLLKSIKLHKYAERNTFIYGTYTIQNRAVPDFRDGLKPVHRRILYSMYKMSLHNNKSVTKSARVAGYCMGAFHPHGSSAIYSSMVNLANPYTETGKLIHKNIPMSLIEGRGNWGWFDDNAAADRYTECKLSKYSDLLMLDKEYMEVMEYVSNYDGKDKEPILLPSLLPTLLLNGASGIAVGTTSEMPPFHIKGVLKLVEKALDGKKITAKLCRKYLKFNYPYGSKCISDKKELLEYFTTGRSSVKFECDYEINQAKNLMNIIGLTPTFNMTRFTNEMYKLDSVVSVNDISDKVGIKIQIKFKPKVDIKNELKKFQKLLRCSVSYKTNITIQKTITMGEVVEQTADFKKTCVPEIINDWTSWRVELEVKMLQNMLRKKELKLKHLELLKFAIKKLDVVFKVLKSKSKDLNKKLSKKLKISIEDAKTILDSQARRLSKLSEEDLNKDIQSIKLEIKKIKLGIKYPNERILASLEKLNIKDFT